MNKFWVLGLAASLAATLMPSAARAADSPVAPFVSPQTNAIIHIDMTQIDMDAVKAMCTKAMATTPHKDPLRAARDQKDMEKDLGKAKKWIADFETAGGRDLYIVVDLSAMFQVGPGAMIVPLDAAASPDQIAKLINPNPRPPNNDPNAPQSPMQADTAVVGKTLIYSTTAMIQKLKAAPANTAHVDLLDGVAAANGSALQIVISPVSIKTNPMLGMMMQGMAGRGNPNGPPPAPPMSEPVWNNVSWILISVTPPPKESGGVICQCKDAASAADLAKLMITKMQEPPDKNQAQQIDPADLEKLKAVFKPVVSGTQVTIMVNQDTIDNVIIPIMIKNSERQSHRPPPPQQPMPDNQPGPGEPNTPGAPPPGPGGL